MAGASVEGSEVESRLLLASVFLVAAAGLVYELIAGTLATYLLGSSITVFSIVIGVFLAAMGLGAWVAQYARDSLANWFLIYWNYFRLFVCCFFNIISQS